MANTTTKKQTCIAHHVQPNWLKGKAQSCVWAEWKNRNGQCWIIYCPTPNYCPYFGLFVSRDLIPSTTWGVHQSSACSEGWLVCLVSWAVFPPPVLPLIWSHSELHLFFHHFQVSWSFVPKEFWWNSPFSHLHLSLWCHSSNHSAVLKGKSKVKHVNTV